MSTTPLTSAVRTVLIGATALFAVACACQDPPLPDDNTETEDTSDTSDTAPTGDTGPEPLCDAPEVEPNDTVNEPTELPMDVYGCGGFEEAGDFDHWSFTLADDAWIEVRVAATNDGSLANVGVILSSDSNTVAAARDDNEGDENVDLLFPAPADTYTLNVREESAQFGERYTYEVIASQAKEPDFYTDDGEFIDYVEEPEPNDDPLAAPSLRDGDAILGFSDAQFDVDHFRVSVPPGRHTLRFEIIAYDEGSVGDFEMTLFDEDLESVKTARFGEVGFERDPILQYNSNGDELLTLQVRDEEGRGNSAMWYLLLASITED